ncbi:FAD-dependent monooxygenase [Nostoc favosum]|uniref:FAD-dependent monooxygenase n=1 Tax=Nostoc favosum CHAB5714 TaxID=2780399 RepID=A0ABS8IE07_9NOSO|nr:FAD-dependent monooxygenase [Nostoc favosum]MCC5602119.1 FAD-dependent monooxygenase [Nostoc favosum CHAB5714]
MAQNLNFVNCSQTDVLIIGAGPTGLTVANILAHYNINFRIIDNKNGSSTESKALAVHAGTLELWDKLRIADKAIEQGQKATEVHLLIRGKPARCGLPLLPLTKMAEGFTPYPYLLVLEQSKTERLLIDALAEFSMQVEWRTELLKLTQTSDETTAIIRHDDGSEETIAAKWVVGADGASSTVRYELNLEFKGSTYGQMFCLADIEMTWSLDRDKYYANLYRQGMFAFFPMVGKNHYRLIATVPPELAAKEKISVEDIQATLDKHSGLNIKVHSANWISRYKIHSRIVERFRVRRCFLAGDAAHIHSPAGGQGMNLGIGDAFNLGWKLALVVRGETHSSLLESYETERMPISYTILNGTDKGFIFQSTSNPLLQQLRLWIGHYLPALMTRTGLIKKFLKLIMQLWIHYRTSPIVHQFPEIKKNTNIVQAGDRAPYDFLKNNANNPVSIFSLLKVTGHQLLVFEGLWSEEQFEDLESKLRVLIAHYSPSICIHLIGKEHHSLHKSYNVNNTSTLFLIRPDGYIAYRGQANALNEFAAYLDTLFTKHEVASITDDSCSTSMVNR